MNRRFVNILALTACVSVILVSGVVAQTPRNDAGQTVHADVGTATGAAVGPLSERPITPELAQSALDRAARAFAIIDGVASEAKARGLGAGWRQSMLEALLPLDVESLRRIEEQARTLDLLSAAITAAAPERPTLGTSSGDFTFTPITPCRFVDTRNAAGKLAGVRIYGLYDVSGALYGGSGACDPDALLGVGFSQILALAMNVTIVDTSTAGAPGYLAVKPDTSSPTTSLLNWYDTGTGVQVANQVIVKAGVDRFVIETSGAVHVIVDIFGGFVVPQATPIQTIQLPTVLMPVGVNQTAQILSAACTSGYALVGGGCFTDNPNHYTYKTVPLGEAWHCASINRSSVVSSIRATAICGRIPGR
jgi:hypothetical protein